MNNNVSREKIDSLLKLLNGDSVSFSEIESVCALASGVNPKIDKLVKSFSPIISTLKNLQEGNVVELSVEGLPAMTEKEKKRKKALVMFIRTWSDLKDEVDRIQAGFQSQKEHQTVKQQAGSVAKLMAGAKGPFGLVTLAAIVIVAGLVYFNSKKTNGVQTVITNEVSSSQSPTMSKTKAIVYQGKKIALSELEIKNGSDCTVAHYHALDHTTATALDGTKVADPGSCGFGKVSETQVVEI